MPVVSSSMHLFEKPLRYTEIGMVSGLKRLAETSSNFNKVRRYSGIYPGVVGAVLPNMYVLMKMQ